MIKPYFQLIAYDGDQSYLRQTRKRRSRSFVQGFLALHSQMLYNSLLPTVTDVDGVGTALNGSGNRFEYSLLSVGPGRAGAAAVIGSGTASDASGTRNFGSAITQGIMVGTGTTSVTPTDYQLATQIVDGVDSGELEHFTCAGWNFTASGSTASFDIERLFRNSSGGSITVNEVGMYAMWSCGNEMGRFCILRDLVSPGFAVADGEYMKVVYTISVTA